MIETKEKILAGHTYACSQLPAMRALKLLSRIGKVAGPAFASMSGAGLDTNLADVARALFDRLSEEETEAILKGLLETVTCDGRPVLTGFDLIFAGRLPEVMQAAAFAFEVNYGDFLGAIRGLLAAQVPAPKAEATA